MICVGGVCVPYTGVIAIAALALRWLAQKLADRDMLPQWIADKLQLAKASKKSVESSDAAATTAATAGTATTTKTSKIHVLEDEDDFTMATAATTSTDQYVVAKFTATWCKPCHRIQPVYAELSGMHKGTFFTVDVDDFDELASKYKVSMMPTFIILHDQQVKSTYAGSDEAQLRTFFRESGIPLDQ